MEKVSAYNRRLHLSSLFFLIILGFLVSGCGAADLDVTVYANDRYEQIITLTIPQDLMEMQGGILEFERTLDEAVAEGKAQGFKVTWRRLNTDETGVYTYELKSGRGKITNSDMDGFGWWEMDYQNRKAYRFEYTNIADLTGGFQSLTLTLHAKKILDTNGTRIDEGTVRWINPYQTPYAVVIPKTSIQWIPLVGGVLLLGGLLLGLLMLFLSGQLKKWSAAGLSTGKWRVQELQIGNERSQSEKKRAALLSQLGVQAWEGRVFDPAYADQYAQLEEVDQQRVALREQTQSIAAELQQARQKRTQVDAEYNRRISLLQEERRQAASRLNQYQSEIDLLQKRISRLHSDSSKAVSELQSFQRRLAQAESSTAPNREEQIASLSNAIQALEQSIAQSTHEIPSLESEIARLKNEKAPLQEAVNNLGQQIEQLQTEQRAELKPLDAEIDRLQTEQSRKNESLAELDKKLEQSVRELGPMVERARPESRRLSGVYAQLDQSSTELTDLSQRQDLLKARIEGTDAASVRNFYITAALTLAVLFLVVVLLVVGLA